MAGKKTRGGSRRGKGGNNSSNNSRPQQPHPSKGIIDHNNER